MVCPSPRAPSSQCAPHPRSPSACLHLSCAAHCRNSVLTSVSTHLGLFPPVPPPPPSLPEEAGCCRPVPIGEGGHGPQAAAPCCGLHRWPQGSTVVGRQLLPSAQASCSFWFPSRSPAHCCGIFCAPALSLPLSRSLVWNLRQVICYGVVCAAPWRLSDA